MRLFRRKRQQGNQRDEHKSELLLWAKIKPDKHRANTTTRRHHSGKMTMINPFISSRHSPARPTGVSNVSRCGDSAAPVRLCVANGCDAAGLRRAAAQYGQAGFVRRFTSELDEDEDEDALQVMQPPTFTRACNQRQYMFV